MESLKRIPDATFIREFVLESQQDKQPKLVTFGGRVWALHPSMPPYDIVNDVCLALESQ